ncbi:hypothetical protein SD70_31030 [Gordoniibacillus kamchatkensis]|uniref:CNNM transmembrane domain-containing protein n=1 Tax=Gordoniibacillus kamchatkensis TaxID=1590651 RepID=A0ABR5A7Y6_9BACL|nr:hypothetical protein SD70_31030 [Paenibacillus sp. VKM B-2647]
MFVAAEFGLVRVRHSRLQQLAEEGNPRAKFALSKRRADDMLRIGTRYRFWGLFTIMQPDRQLTPGQVAMILAGQR